MKIEAIYYILATFVITIVATVVCIIINNRKKNVVETNYFERLYTTKSFNSIASDSSKAGKWNSPFINGDNILDTITKGMAIVDCNIFEAVGDCDERPNWN